MSKSVVNLTKSNMESEVSSGVTLVDFWADWCGPCKMLAPVLDELYEERSDFKLAKVDCDDQQELANSFGITGIPTVILFKDGQPLHTAVGVRAKEYYGQILNEANNKG